MDHRGSREGMGIKFGLRQTENRSGSGRVVFQDLTKIYSQISGIKSIIIGSVDTDVDKFRLSHVNRGRQNL